MPFCLLLLWVFIDAVELQTPVRRRQGRVVERDQSRAHRRKVGQPACYEIKLVRGTASTTTIEINVGPRTKGAATAQTFAGLSYEHITAWHLGSPADEACGAGLAVSA
jgi:hypothetical protein